MLLSTFMNNFYKFTNIKWSDDNHVIISKPLDLQHLDQLTGKSLDFDQGYQVLHHRLDSCE